MSDILTKYSKNTNKHQTLFKHYKNIKKNVCNMSVKCLVSNIFILIISYNKLINILFCHLEYKINSLLYYLIRKNNVYDVCLFGRLM